MKKRRGKSGEKRKKGQPRGRLPLCDQMPLQPITEVSMGENSGRVQRT